jgi:hypothetical protein
VLLDEVGHGLGVGLRREGVPVRGEALPELAVVLDDPVQDDGELLGLLRGQRVGVRLGDASVGRPARVPEDVVAGDVPFPARSRRFCRLPTARVYVSPESSSSAMPAES